MHFLYLNFAWKRVSSLIFFFIGVQSLYNAVLVSVVQKSESAIHMHLFGFPGGSLVRDLPAMQETWVQSLDRGDPMEEEIATHSSILA